MGFDSFGADQLHLQERYHRKEDTLDHILKTVAELEKSASLLPDNCSEKNKIQELIKSLKTGHCDIGISTEKPKDPISNVCAHFEGWGGGDAMMYTLVGLACFYLVRSISGISQNETYVIVVFALISLGSTAFSYGLSHSMNKMKDILRGKFWEWARNDFRRLVIIAVIISSSLAGLVRGLFEAGFFKHFFG